MEIINFSSREKGGGARRIFFFRGGVGVKERHLYVQAKITLGESLPQMASAIIISFLSRWELFTYTKLNRQLGQSQRKFLRGILIRVCFFNCFKNLNVFLVYKEWTHETLGCHTVIGSFTVSIQMKFNFSPLIIKTLEQPKPFLCKMENILFLRY